MIEAIDFSSDTPALFTEERRTISYRELGRRIEIFRDILYRVPRPALAFQFAPNSVGAIAAYLACLAEKLPVALGEPAGVAQTRIIEAYDPTILFLSDRTIIAPSGYVRVGTPIDGICLWQRVEFDVYPTVPHPQLAILLSTSGSTGDAKFVRISAGNLLANAIAISRYLNIQPTDVAIQSLPMHYSYGLSLLNSHLVAGATVALTAHSFMRPEFWHVVDDCRCTSFAGVPYMYETLHRLRIVPTARPHLRTLTQAGGHLRVDLVQHFNTAARAVGARLFVMYGQTEATARIAYVPPERLADKLGSIGIAIPGGELWIEPVEGEPALKQLYYRGPNVSFGYASDGKDLARDDDFRGVLATGDLGEVDADGFFRITGRLARFAKLFGRRINLAAVEAESESLLSLRSAAVDGGDHLRVFVERGGEQAAERMRAHLAELLGVPPLALKVAALAELPLTASGKKDYKALK